MYVDFGTETAYFKRLPAVTSVTEIEGPIHVDKTDSTKHTQTVEGSHSGVKMSLRLGRGLPRHQFQSVMDLEDFTYNRTNVSPQDIFKKIGDIATIHAKASNNETKRHSSNTIKLRKDIFGSPEGLSLSIIESLCSPSVFAKASRYEVASSMLVSTQSFPCRNTISGDFRSARVHN